MSSGRLGLNSSSAAHNVSSTSLPSSSAVMAGLDVHSATVSSQSAPQSPLNAPGLLPSSRPVSSYSPSQSPSPSMAAISASSLDANVVSDSLTSTMATATATPVDPLPSLSASSSSSSFLPSASLTAPAVVTAAGRTPGSVPASSGGGGGGGYKGVAMGGSAGGHQGKAVLRQHGGPSSHSKSSVGGNLVVKVPDEPLPDPTVCEVKPGKETTIEVNKDKLGLGLSIVGGSDTLLVKNLN